MVVAETVAAAKDGAEQVVIDYQPLPCVTFAPDAAKSGRAAAPRAATAQMSASTPMVGDGAATEAAFARAGHIAKIKTWMPRVAGSPMEPRAAIGDYDAATGATRSYLQRLDAAPAQGPGVDRSALPRTSCGW